VTKPKLYKLLSTLSKREVQDFRLFLLSPYHNQSQILLALFDHIRPYHPSFNHKQLERELIFKALKPNKDFDKKYVIDRLSDLNRLVEDFLTAQYIKKHPKENRTLFRKSLLEHQSQIRYLQETQKEIDKLERKPRVGWEFTHELWLLYHVIFSHPHTQLFDAKKDEAFLANQYLDETYAIIKLRYGLHRLFRNSIFSEADAVPLLDAVIEKFVTSKNPIIQLYIKTFTYLSNEPDITSWKEICDMFLQFIPLLPPDEKPVFLFALVNAGNKLGRNKNPYYYDDILLLYKKALEHNFWKVLGDFPSITFKNIANLGAFSKQFEWTANFIKDYQQFIPKKERAHTLHYAYAFLEFHKGSFERAIDYLNEVPLLLLEDKLRNRSLQCRCKYEINCPTLNSYLDNFATFIKNQKFDKGKKQAYQNLIYALRLLCSRKGKYGINKQEKELLKVKLNKRASFVDYDWIMRKIDEL